jgi:hypothetical protein
VLTLSTLRDMQATLDTRYRAGEITVTEYMSLSEDVSVLEARYSRSHATVR